MFHFHSFLICVFFFFFFFQAEDGIRDLIVTGVQTCALPILIEAVREHLGTKQQVFAEVDRAAPADALLATNTSSLSVAAIAAAARDPGREIGRASCRERV